MEKTARALPSSTGTRRSPSPPPRRRPCTRGSPSPPPLRRPSTRMSSSSPSPPPRRPSTRKSRSPPSKRLPSPPLMRSPSPLSSRRFSTRSSPDTPHRRQDDQPRKTHEKTGDRWRVYVDFLGGPMDQKRVILDLDPARVTFASLLRYKVKNGYSARDFMYYMKRCGNDTALLQRIDYEKDALTMIEDCTEEKIVRVVVSTTQEDQEGEYAITPIKQRSIHEEVSAKGIQDEDIDAYKVWLKKLPQDENNPEFKDDTRLNTVETYKEWLRREGLLQDIYAYLDDETIEEDGSGDNSATPMKFPAHARRPKASQKVGVGDKRKSGRGTLKGLSVDAKRFKLGTEKLSIDFSSTKGGPIGDNYRGFVDEIVRFTRKMTPLIGVKKWGDVKKIVKDTIARDIMVRWRLENNDEEKARIWKIARYRYRGWRAQLSATYKAYNSYHERMRHKPDDLDIVEWHYLVLYFGSDKFQQTSTTNSSNSQHRQTIHRTGSKPFSQVSYVQRNLETGEEPDGLTFWRSTRTKDGRWSSDAAREIYESAFSKIEERMELEGSVISKEKERHILHETYKETTRCRSRKGPGHGYMAKYPTRSQLMNERIEEQARASALAAAAQQKNNEMQAELEKLKEQHTIQATERESDKEKIQQLQHQLESTSSKIREELREELRKEFFSLMKQHNQIPPLNVAPTTTATQPAETTIHPSEFTANSTGIENMAGTESVLPTHNEPAVVPTPIQGLEHVQQTIVDSVLLSKQKSGQHSRLTRSTNRSLFTNDKDSNETVAFISSQALRNTVANKKRQRKKGAKEDQP